MDRSNLEDLFFGVKPYNARLLHYLPANYSNFMKSSSNKVIIQGIDCSLAALYAVQMKAYGTDIIAGVSPGLGGTKIEDFPVFDLVEQVSTITEQIDTSLIFVHPYQVLDAVQEAISAGIRRVIVVTSNVPPQDTIKLMQYAKATKTLLLGPGSQGLVIPQKIWLGKLKPQFYQPGKVGLITKSEHLSYEVAAELNKANLGQSIVVSLGNDRITASNLPRWLSILNEDPDTEAIVSIGQKINETEAIITYCKEHGYDKPIVAYIAGIKTPQEIEFRDAVTIISNHLSVSIPAVNQGRRIINQLKKVGIKVAKRPSEISSTILEEISKS